MLNAYTTTDAMQGLAACMDEARYAQSGLDSRLRLIARLLNRTRLGILFLPALSLTR